MSKLKLVSIFFVIGAAMPFALKTLLEPIDDSEIGLQFKVFLAGVFTLGIIIGGFVGAISSYFLAIPIDPFTMVNSFSIGISNGLYYSLFGFILWKGIYEKKKWLIYFLGIVFLVIVIISFKISTQVE